MVRGFWIACLTLVCALCGSTARADAPVRYDLSLELRTPIYNSLYNWGGAKTVHPEMAGSLKLINLLPAHGVLWINGEHTFQQHGVFKPENKMKVGMDFPVGRDVCVFTYLDRRFDVDVNRVFVGFRLNFKGALQ